MIPEGRPPAPAPHPLIDWGDLSVTGNGDLPLASQRRVESIASDRTPFPVACSISLVCDQLFSSLFFFDFHRTNLRIPIRRWHWEIAGADFPPISPRERHCDLQRRWNRLLQRTAALKDHPSGRRRAGSGSAPTADDGATAGRLGTRRQPHGTESRLTLI